MRTQKTILFSLQAELDMLDNFIIHKHIISEEWWKSNLMLLTYSYIDLFWLFHVQSSKYSSLCTNQKIKKIFAMLAVYNYYLVLLNFLRNNMTIELQNMLQFSLYGCIITPTSWIFWTFAMLASQYFDVTLFDCCNISPSCVTMGNSLTQTSIMQA